MSERVTLLAAEGQEGFHVPTLDELFEWPTVIHFELGGYDLGLNRTALLMLLSVVIIGLMMLAAFARPKLIPGKFQAAMEAIVGFVRDNVVMEVIGPNGLRFVPLLTSLFLFIWINNLFEILPFINFPTTSRMAIPMLLAMMVWTIFVIVGIKEQGPLKYFKNVAIPGGVPKAILVLVVPIEIVSTFLVRPLTLSVRLFANMVAGHILLAIVFIAANAFLFSVTSFDFNLKGSPIGLVAVLAGPFLVGFELLIGVLQAYIFTILAAVYISGSMQPEH